MKMSRKLPPLRSDRFVLHRQIGGSFFSFFQGGDTTGEPQNEVEGWLDPFANLAAARFVSGRVWAIGQALIQSFRTWPVDGGRYMHIRCFTKICRAA